MPPIAQDRQVKLNIMQSQNAKLRPHARMIPFAFCVGLGLSAISSQAQDVGALLEESIIKVVEKSEPSVVSIARFKPSIIDQIQEKNRPFQRDLPPREVDVQPNDFGSGCIVSPSKSADRFVLTTYHVVRGGPIYDSARIDPFKAADGTELMIQFADSRASRAAIIAADPRSDLAVLRLDWARNSIKPTDFPSFDWESGTAPRKGQFVILLGNPHAIARDGSASVSWGMVSNLTRQPISHHRVQDFDMEDLTKSSMLHRLGTVMQLDARMNLGLSGGPVLNLKGELIGISTSLAAIEGYEQSVGFALPIDSLTRRIIETLLSGREVEYGMLGISPRTISGDEFLNLNTGATQQSAALIRKVSHGSPAELAGLSAGDVILKVEETPVLSFADLMRLVGLHPPGTEIELTVWRRAVRVPHQDIIRVKLGKWPVQDAEGVIETNPRYAPWRGLTVDYPTGREMLRDREESYDFRHVVVTKVAPNSPAEVAKLEPGTFITHVNNKRVQTPAEFHAAVKGLTGLVKLRLHERVVQIGEATDRD